MHETPELPAPIAGHIRAAGRASQSRRLLRYLTDASWPTSTADRDEPRARSWLSLWGPVRTVVSLPACGCEQGRCRVCN